MTVRESSIGNIVKINNSTPTDITQSLGHEMRMYYTIDNQSEQLASMGAGADFTSIVDNVVQIKCGMVLHPTDITTVFDEFKIFASDGILEPLEIWGNCYDTGASMNTVKIEGAKMGTITLRASKSELPIEITAEGFATDISVVNTEISQTPTSSARETYLNAYVQMGGVTIGSVDNVSITVERSLEPLRGIEEVSAGDIRKPSQILECMRDIRFTATIEVSDLTGWKKVFGDASVPLVIQDTRSAETFAVVTANGTITLTGALVQVLDYSMDRDACKVKTIDIQGMALTGAVT